MSIICDIAWSSMKQVWYENSKVHWIYTENGLINVKGYVLSNIEIENIFVFIKSRLSNEGYL